MLGEVVQTQRLLRRVLVLEQRAAAAIEGADRGEAGRRNPKFGTEISQYWWRDHLHGIEQRAREPQKSDLQRHAQPVQRSAMPLNSAPYFL